MTIVGILSLGGLYLYAYLSPKISIKNNGKYYIYDQDKNLVYQGSSTSEWVSIDNINDNMKNAIISIEDKNFYNHEGFDYLRIAGAMVKNIKNKAVIEGASTISQQYIKNMYLSFDKTWSRKIEEALLTLELEVHYTKDEILESYLNSINFGQGNYGIQNAAKYYFNKDAKDLTLTESCILASIPKSPANYNPVSNYDKSISRAKVVAKSMLENKFITKEEYSKLFQDKINIYGKRDTNNLDTLMYYQDAVIDELQNLTNIPSSIIDSGGLKIYTTLDLNVQKSMEENMKEHMNEDDAMQIASIYLDPNTGGVKALIGGKNYSKSQYNRATKAKRQVGSTIKPFLYYTALANGLTMSSTFTSEKTNFNLSNNNVYSPSNYNNIYGNKDITMAAALAYSDNVFAVKTHMFLGEEALVDTMKMVGLKETLDAIPSLALGTNEINMIDYSNAYLTLASGGFNKEAHFITRVENNEGDVLYNYKEKKERILNYNYVYILNEMLTNTYSTEFIDYNSPTAISIKGRLSKNYAIKTGTTDNDHWVVGYNKDALMMVWTGSDDNLKTNSGYSKITKNIWADTMEETLLEKEDNWYDLPPNVIGIPLDPITGEYSKNTKASMFYFVKGSEPKYYVTVSN